MGSPADTWVTYRGETEAVRRPSSPLASPCPKPWAGGFEDRLQFTQSMEWANDLGEKGAREGLGFLGSECLSRSISPLAGTDTDELRGSGLASLPSVGRVPGLACGSVCKWASTGSCCKPRRHGGSEPG